MTWWPGWNSVENANIWAHIWFWFGMWCFLWLGISEVIAFVYGLRKDSLVAVAQQQTAQHAAEDQSALQRQLANAEKTITELKSQNIARRLDSGKKAELTAALAHYPGQKVSFVCPNTAWDCVNLVGDLTEAMKAANWDVSDNVAMVIPTNGYDPVGIQFGVNPDWASPDPQKAPASLLALGNALASIGLMPAGVNRQPSLAPGMIQIIIGRIPPAQ